MLHASKGVPVSAKKSTKYSAERLEIDGQFEANTWLRILLCWGVSLKRW